VSYVTFSDVAEVFVQEFGCHPDDIFDKFDRRPIASASLAQVHRARLATPDGTKDVAVKLSLRFNTLGC
jgi:aarF domain-containing kinase